MSPGVNYPCYCIHFYLFVTSQVINGQMWQNVYNICEKNEANVFERVVDVNNLFVLFYSGWPTNYHEDSSVGGEFLLMKRISYS